ncbi:MAG TPA: malate synthase A [Actinomycetota bacterium]|nr:malate synthase A [Actinomycetota bacterium]
MVGRTVELEIVGGTVEGEADQVLTDQACAFVADLHRRFEPARRRLLAARAERQRRLDAGERPEFRPDTAAVRAGDWRVAPVPSDLADRRVEITGPVERKMMINALNSGARVFMADFEDSLSPTWANVVNGQRNLQDAVRRTITYTAPDGRHYSLEQNVATLVVRPRGWHLHEKHVRVAGEPVSASLFDFGLAFFHNARELVDRGSGPYFYLPKLESHEEARLWNEVFLAAQEALGLPAGTVKATVLIETILAAFEMEEILFELREHAGGLNAGRWDYIFSVIKKFHQDPGFVLPDRARVTMAVPFMRAYTELMVATCHRRGAHAIGGMAAFIPNRQDPEVTEAALAGVRADKLREAAAGFDGTWVAHPDLLPTAAQVFDDTLGDRPNQLDRLREDVKVTGEELLAVADTPGEVTEPGVRTNVSVGIQYLESWLRGVGAAAIANLMEDAATCEISRAQLWQWHHHAARLDDGRVVTPQLIGEIADDELARLEAALGPEVFAQGRFGEARRLFEQVVLEEPLVEFLTLPAYEELP